MQQRRCSGHSGTLGYIWPLLCIVLDSSKKVFDSFQHLKCPSIKIFQTKYLNLHKNVWPENKSRVWQELEDSGIVFELIYFWCFDRNMICISPSIFNITNLRQKIWSHFQPRTFPDPLSCKSLCLSYVVLFTYWLNVTILNVCLLRKCNLICDVS